MSDDESQNEHLPAEGDEIFTENGSETVENDQTGVPPWAAAVTAQIQKVFTEQLEVHLAAQAQANRAELQDLIGECRTTPTLLLRVLRCYEPRQSQMFACCLPK